MGLAKLEGTNHSARDQVLAVHNLLEQAEGEGLLGGDGLAEEQQLERAGAAEKARQALRAAPAGEQAERRAGVAEDGIGRSEAAMAGEGEVEPAAEAVAADGGDDGLVGVDDAVEEKLGAAGEVERARAGEGGELGDFRPGGEGFVGAVEDDRLARRVGEELSESGVKLLEQGSAESGKVIRAGELKAGE